MRRKAKSKTYFGIIALIVIVTTIILVLESDSITRDDSSFSFEIPIPETSLDFSGQTSTNSNASILCTVKHTNFGIDSTGGTVSTTQSSGISGNPLLSLATIDGIKMAGYVIDFRGFCQNTFNDDNVNDPDRFTFVFEPSNMSVQVQSNDIDGTKKTTHFASFTTKSKEIPIGGGEVSLGTVGIYSSQIEDNLSQGCFDTTNQFDIRGNLVVFWKGFQGVKYTIPVKFGDITSFHNAKVLKGSCDTGEFSGTDSDGDGIKDTHDSCPTQPENYNGVEDGDGCPDSSSDETDPNENDTGTGTSPIIYTECLRDNKTWYMDSKETKQSYCATLLKINDSGTQKNCGFYDVETQVCYIQKENINTVSGCVQLADGTKICPSDDIFQSGGECHQKDMDVCSYKKQLALDPSIDDGFVDSLDGTMRYQVDIDYSDGSNGAFLAKDDPSPLRFSIPLSVLGGTSANELRAVSEFTVEPKILFNDSKQHNLVTTQSSDLTAQVWITINGQFIKIKEAPVDDFRSINGASAEDGISLGTINVKMSEIEGKIPATLVGINNSADLQIKVIVRGDVVINFNDGGTIKEFTIRIAQGSGETTADNLLDGETSFVWTNLKIARGTAIGDLEGGGSTGGSEEVKEKCDVNEIGFRLNDGELECIPKGTTPVDGDGDGNLDNTAVCKLDSGSGDSNGDGLVCQICTDDASGIGGFPCDQDYRDNYCSGTTECGSPKSGDTVNGFKSEGTGGGSTGGSVCPNTLNLSTASCTIQTGNSPSIFSENGDVCSNGVCVGQFDEMIIYMIVGVLIVIIIAVAVAKRRQ